MHDRSVFNAVVSEAVEQKLEYERLRATFMLLNGFQSTLGMRPGSAKLLRAFAQRLLNITTA